MANQPTSPLTYIPPLQKYPPFKQKTACNYEKNRQSLPPKGNDRIPTIHSQGPTWLAGIVSGRVHPWKLTNVPQKRTISVGNTSSNHWFSGDMLVFRKGVRFFFSPTPIRETPPWLHLGTDPENHSVTRMPAGLIVPHVYFSRLSEAWMKRQRVEDGFFWFEKRRKQGVFVGGWLVDVCHVLLSLHIWYFLKFQGNSHVGVDFSLEDAFTKLDHPISHVKNWLIWRCR